MVCATVIDSRVSLCRLTSLAGIFVSLVIVTRYFPSRVLMTLSLSLSLCVLHAGVPTLLTSSVPSFLGGLLRVRSLSQLSFLLLTWHCASWSAGTLLVWWSLGALSLPRRFSRCGLGLLRYTGYPGVPFVLSASSASASARSLGSLMILYLRQSSRCAPLSVPFLRRWHQSLRTDREDVHSCCSATVSALLDSCEPCFAPHLIDLLQDDRVLSLYNVLDNLKLFHLHCVDIVLVMLVMHPLNLFNGLLLDLLMICSCHLWMS